MMRKLGALAAVFGFVFLRAEPALANDPPAAQTMLANLSIVPIALALFAFTGAAALYDKLLLRKQLEDSAPKRRRRPGWALGIATVACLLSGAQEGFALLLSPVLCVYAILIAARMIRASRQAPRGSRTCTAALLGGALLIPLSIFLASFSFAFLDSWSYGRHDFCLEPMRRFASYQDKYAHAHDGLYHEVAMPKRWEPKDEEEAEVWRKSAVKRLRESVALSMRGSVALSKCSITYGPDLKSYEVRLTPTAFYPWPYRYLAPARISYFMDQTGVIRYRKMRRPGEGATAASPKLGR